MRYIRITRALNREENYVLNRDVCYYCTGTANISIRLRAVVSKRRAYPSDCEIQYIFREFFFFFLNETRNCSFRIEISLDPFCTLSDQLAFGYNSILLFRLRCGNWKKGRRRWIYTVRFARALLSTRNPCGVHRSNRTVTRRKLILEIILVPLQIEGIILSPISTKNILETIFSHRSKI